MALTRFEKLYEEPDPEYTGFLVEAVPAEPADELEGLGTKILNGNACYQSLKKAEAKLAAGNQDKSKLLPEIAALRYEVASITMTLDRALQLDGETWEQRFASNYEQVQARRAGQLAIEAPDVQPTQSEPDEQTVQAARSFMHVVPTPPES